MAKSGFFVVDSPKSDRLLARVIHKLSTAEPYEREYRPFSSISLSTYACGENLEKDRSSPHILLLATKHHE